MLFLLKKTYSEAKRIKYMQRRHPNISDFQSLEVIDFDYYDNDIGSFHEKVFARSGYLLKKLKI